MENRIRVRLVPHCVLRGLAHKWIWQLWVQIWAPFPCIIPFILLPSSFIISHKPVVYFDKTYLHKSNKQKGVLVLLLGGICEFCVKWLVSVWMSTMLEIHKMHQIVAKIKKFPRRSLLAEVLKLQYAERTLRKALQIFPSPNFPIPEIFI